MNGDRATAHEGSWRTRTAPPLQLSARWRSLHEAAGSRQRLHRHVPVGALVLGLASGWSSCEPRRPLTATSSWTGSSRATSPTKSRSCAPRRGRFSRPESPSSATCARVPVLVGHPQGGLDRETEGSSTPARASEALEAAPGVRVSERPDSQRSGGPRRGARWAHPEGDRRSRARVVDRLRQPAQGRSAERGRDRNACWPGAPSLPRRCSAQKTRLLGWECHSLGRIWRKCGCNRYEMVAGRSPEATE